MLNMGARIEPRKVKGISYMKQNKTLIKNLVHICDKEKKMYPNYVQKCLSHIEWIILTKRKF